jgi:hypothetical protein
VLDILAQTFLDEIQTEMSIPLNSECYKSDIIQIPPKFLAHEVDISLLENSSGTLIYLASHVIVYMLSFAVHKISKARKWSVKIVNYT